MGRLRYNSDSTIDRWKKVPEFQARIHETLAACRAKALECGLARKQKTPRGSEQPLRQAATDRHRARRFSGDEIGPRRFDRPGQGYLEAARHGQSEAARTRVLPKYGTVG